MSDTSSMIIRNLDASVRQRLKVRAAQLGISMNVIVCRLIDGFLDGRIHIDLTVQDTPEERQTLKEHTL